MFLDNIQKRDEYEFDIFSYSASIDSAMDAVRQDKFGMLNKLSEDLLSEGLFDKNESLNKIKQKTLNLLKREKERAKKAEKLKNSKEHRIVDKKIGPLLKQKAKYMTGKYKDKNLRDEKVQREFQSDITSIFKEVFSVDFSDTEGISEAIILFFIIFLLQSFILSILNLFCGGICAMILLSVFVTPILEEMAKNYEVKRNNIGNFSFILNASETILYFVKGDLAGRIPAIIMHYITSLIQTKIIREDESNDKLSLIVSIIIHSLYNLAASFTVLNS